MDTEVDSVEVAAVVSEEDSAEVKHEIRWQKKTKKEKIVFPGIGGGGGGGFGGGFGGGAGGGFGGGGGGGFGGGFGGGQIVQKHIYVHVPPPEPEEFRPQRPISVAPAQKNYKIIFIKAPSAPTPTAPVIPLQPQNEEKTLVYVLVKRPDEAPEISIPTPAPTQPSKPEVYFIRYKTQVNDFLNSISTFFVNKWQKLRDERESTVYFRSCTTV